MAITEIPRYTRNWNNKEIDGTITVACDAAIVTLVRKEGQVMYTLDPNARVGDGGLEHVFEELDLGDVSPVLCQGKEINTTFLSLLHG